VADESAEMRLLLQQLAGNLSRVESQLDKLVSREVWDSEHRHLQRQLDDHIAASAQSLHAAREEIFRAIKEVDKHSAERHATALQASKEVGDDLREYRDERQGHREFTWNRGLALALVLATIIAALITVLATRGGH
jgi:t-SNARE complex subunit (syntaxin)